MVTRRQRGPQDRGGVLILTMVLVITMAVVVIALAQYVSVGLRTSGVASERTDTNADSSNVMHWAIEQFARRSSSAPTTTAVTWPTYLPITVPVGLVGNGSMTTLTCAQTNPINGEPVVHLIARSTGDQTRVVEATVEIPQYSHGARCRRLARRHPDRGAHLHHHDDLHHDDHDIADAEHGAVRRQHVGLGRPR